jgi:hypothetical protein
VRSLILPKTGLATSASRLADTGDEAQASRRLFDPDERADLQGQGDQHGSEEQQDGAEVGRRVQGDEAGTDPTALRHRGSSALSEPDE